MPFFFIFGMTRQFLVFLSKTNNLQIVVLFKVFLSNINNYMVSSNYFHLRIVI